MNLTVLLNIAKYYDTIEKTVLGRVRVRERDPDEKLYKRHAKLQAACDHNVTQESHCGHGKVKLKLQG